MVMKADDRSNERPYGRRFDMVVGSTLRDRDDNRFNSQRENFANLFISGPPTENNDVNYGNAARGQQRTGARFTAESNNRISGNRF